MANLMDIIIVFIALFNLVITAIIAKNNDFVFTKGLGKILMTEYFVMFIAVTGIQIWYIVSGQS